MLFLLTEVLVDLTGGPPPQKKIWPEIKDAEDGPPPADAKAKAKAEKEKKKKLIDVSNKLYLQFDFRHFIVVQHLASNAKLEPCAKRLETFGGFSVLELFQKHIAYDPPTM